jgi:hypothetical protein
MTEYSDDHRVQFIADKKGFGEQWREMCKEKTPDAARAAADAVYIAARADARAAADPFDVLERMTYLGETK